MDLWASPARDEHWSDGPVIPTPWETERAVTEISPETGRPAGTLDNGPCARRLGVCHIYCAAGAALTHLFDQLEGNGALSSHGVPAVTGLGHCEPGPGRHGCACFPPGDK